MSTFSTLTLQACARTAGRLMLAALVVWSPVVGAQRPRPRDDLSVQAARARDFIQQRAYPNNTIPWNVYPRALGAARLLANRAPAAPGASSGSANAWRSIGPTVIDANGTTFSGRVNGVAVSPSDPNIVYLTAAGGGAWKSTDGGVTWNPLTNDACLNVSASIAVDPNDANTVFVGTGFWPYWEGCGLLRSTDGGASWTRISPSSFATPWTPQSDAAIIAIGIIPSASHTPSTSTVLLATDVGLYRSTDGGTTWTHPLNTNWYYPIPGLAIDASAPNVAYAAAVDVYNKNSISTGIFKTTDGGATWMRLSGYGQDFTDMRLAVAGTPSVLYASANGADGWLGIAMSTDGGASWTKRTSLGNSEFVAVAPDPTNPAVVFAEGVNLYKSVDSARTFTPITGAMHVDFRSMAFAPDGSAVWVGTDGGPYRTRDGGTTWDDMNGSLTLTQFYPGIAVDRANAQHIFAGSQDNGIEQYDGSRWTMFWGGDGGYQIIDPSGGHYLEDQWDGSPGAGPYYVNATGIWSSRSSGINHSEYGIWEPPMVMDPVDSKVLYFGTNHVYRTRDGGLSWTAISGNVSKGSGAVATIAVSPVDTLTIWAGTTDGNVVVTRDGGATWAVVTSGIPDRYVSRIVADPSDARGAYAIVSGFGTGHVFRTRDGGASWQNISGNLPDVPANSFAVVPTKNSIFVGTDIGVFASSLDGGQWSTAAPGLPTVIVNDLVYHEATNTLIAATHGRSMYALTLAGGQHGDVDGDGRITALDAQLVLQAVAGFPLPTGITVATSGDVNCDGQITAVDAQIILSYVVGIDVSRFCVGKSP